MAYRPYKSHWFYSFSQSPDNQLLASRLAKGRLCIVKGALSACDSWPFALRFAAFYKSVGRAALPIPSANIVKGECKAKQKTKFFKFAFPGRILYLRSRYNERREHRQAKDEVFMQKSRMPDWHTGFLFYSPIVVTGYFFSTFTVVPSALRTMLMPFCISFSLRPLRS